MWVGNSMLFNWLDRNLEKSVDLDKLSQGKIYMVHSGASYDVEKKLLAPGAMPKTLHWFKYQNLMTWLSGIALLIVVYYMHGASFLIDPRVAELTPAVAISLSGGSLLVGWIGPDGLWDSYGKQHPVAAGGLSDTGAVGCCRSRCCSGRSPASRRRSVDAARSSRPAS